MPLVVRQTRHAWRIRRVRADVSVLGPEPVGLRDVGPRGAANLLPLECPPVAVEEARAPLHADHPPTTRRCRARGGGSGSSGSAGRPGGASLGAASADAAPAAACRLAAPRGRTAARLWSSPRSAVTRSRARVWAFACIQRSAPTLDRRERLELSRSGTCSATRLLGVANLVCRLRRCRRPMLVARAEASDRWTRYAPTGAPDRRPPRGPAGSPPSQSPRPPRRA